MTRALEHESAGLRYETRPDVYDPSDDTWLLLSALRARRGERMLEVGCGTGLVAIHAARGGAHVTASDVNPLATQLTRANARRNHVDVNIVRADLDRGLAWSRFDTVAFNPPYLPTLPDERLPSPLNAAFDGGRAGRLVALRFLRALARHNVRDAWLVVSTLQSLDDLADAAQSHGIQWTVAARKTLAHEALEVWNLDAS